MSVTPNVIFRIETNTTLVYVSHTNEAQVREAMHEYLRAWREAGNSLSSAKYVYQRIELTRRLPRNL